MTISGSNAISAEDVGGIIDSDGHLTERDRDFYPYFDHAKHPIERLERYYLFPDLDGARRPTQGGFDGNGVAAAGFVKFLDLAGIEASVTFPTVGLALGNIDDIDWAIDLCRAYNDWVAAEIMGASPRLKAVALIPVQEPAAAAEELERAVCELGFAGGLLPVPGLKRAYGDSAFDPIYEVAQRLGTTLGVHGAGFRGIGLEFPLASKSRSTSGRRSFRLSHPAQPFTQMTQFIHMISEGLWERFPELKVSFLETSCGWVTYWVERIDDKAGRPIAENQLRNSPVYFHAELGQTRQLNQYIDLWGDDRLLYATDWPHEPEEEIKELLAQFLASDQVAASTKRKILRDNVNAFYGF